MRREKNFLILLIFCAFVSVILSAGCLSPDTTDTGESVTIMQTDGTLFTLPHAAERIVLMNSNAAEMLYVIGASDKVVGVSQSILDHIELGPLFLHATSVGKWDVPDVELISSLNPDIVIAFASSKPKNVDTIESAGIPIVYIDCYKPTTMIEDVQALGILTGNEEKASEFIAFYTGVMNNVSSTISDVVSIPRVYCEGYTEYSGQAKGSGMDLLLDIVQGENIFMEETGDTAPKISPEWLIGENPDAIIKVVTVAKMSDASGEFDSLVSRTGFSSINAVAYNRTWVISNDIAYGPRTFAGAVAVAKLLHPEEAMSLDVESVLDAYNAQFGLHVSNGILVYPALPMHTQ